MQSLWFNLMGAVGILHLCRDNVAGVVQWFDDFPCSVVERKIIKS